MSTITTRSTGSSPKGAPLTAGELDANFINLNADKVEQTRAINTTAGDLTGGGDLSGDRTLGLATTGITAGTVNNSTTQLTPLTLDAKGRVIGVGTPTTMTPDFSNVANKPTTLAGYGITDAQATISGAATTIDTEDLTASRVLVSDSSGKVAVASTTTTVLGYLDATSSVQGQLDNKQSVTSKNAANGYAGLDANAKLPTSLLPALAISEYLGAAANQAARLALTGERGDWCSQADNGKVYVITGDDPTDNANWTALTYPVTPGITLNGTSIAPGDTATITAATTNTLTLSTGLTGTSFNGSSAVTVAIDSSVVTLTGTQTLTNKTLTSPAITGGTANNVAIGGTTAAAGAFTTLSASSTVSGTGFSTYLASPPAIGGTTAAAVSSTNLAYTGTLTGGTGVIAIGTNQIYKDASGNVGIGTSSPAVKLDVNGSGRFRGFDSGYYNENVLAIGNGSFNPKIGLSSNNGYRWNTRIKDVGGNGEYVIRYEETSNDVLIIDRAGNLGLGVTPSAWQAAGTLQGPGFSISQMLGVNQTAWATGCYQDSYSAFGGWKSKGAYSPVLYSQSGSTHIWCVTAQSFSAAGQTVVWNQAMTLDASGNLLVGVTTKNAGATATIADSFGLQSATGKTVETVGSNSNPVSNVIVDITGGSDATSFYVDIKLSAYLGFYANYSYSVYKTNSWTSYGASIVNSQLSAGITVTPDLATSGRLRFTLTGTNITAAVVSVKVVCGSSSNPVISLSYT